MTDYKKRIGDSIPCIDPYCDKNGTTMDGNESEAYPAQCQYCFQERFPLIDKLNELLHQVEAETDRNSRQDELLQAKAKLIHAMPLGLDDEEEMMLSGDYINYRLASLTHREES